MADFIIMTVELILIVLLAVVMMGIIYTVIQFGIYIYCIIQLIDEDKHKRKKK